MDIPTRVLIALFIIGGGFLIGVPLAISKNRKRRAEKLRRRGIKSYNRDRESSGTP